MIHTLVQYSKPKLMTKSQLHKLFMQLVEALNAYSRYVFVKHNCLYDQHPNTKTEYWQLTIPLTRREEILRDMHEGTLGGHLGEEKTFGRLRKRYTLLARLPFGCSTLVSNMCKLCCKEDIFTEESGLPAKYKS